MLRYVTRESRFTSIPAHLIVWDPKTQTDIIDGCWTGYIDPALSPEKRESGDITTSRMIIYAVRPWAWKDQFPKVNMVERDYADSVRAKWQGVLEYLRK